MKRKLLLGLLIVLLGSISAGAQQKLKFSVSSFELDPFDTTPQNKVYEKIDGSGFRYAIIKVSSTNPDDNLMEYNFNFGNLKSIVEQHDNELWVYVQKNAKLVTISRNGYTTLNKYDLKTTIQDGKVYVMLLNAAKPVVYTQMVQFNVTPANAGAVVTIKSSNANSQEEMFGTTDVTGSVAKALPLGTYTYKIIANNYHTSEGRLTLTDRNKTQKEIVNLKSNAAEMTFNVDTDADIYINGEYKGKRTWVGILKSGNYQVECRLPNHHTTIQYVTVTDDNNQTVMLSAPAPMTGTLAITSTPLGGNIIIDGKGYGVTPQNINDQMIGNHIVTISMDGYKSKSQYFNIKENETTTVDVVLESILKRKQNARSKEKATKVVKQTNASSTSCGYIQASAQVGTMMGYGANAGAYIYQELGYALAWGNWGIKAGESVRITPQIGAGVLNVSGDGVGSNATCATAGVRVEIDFTNNVGLSLAPEGQFAVSKKEVFKQLEEVSSKIKGWGTGANLRIGLYVRF